MLRKARVAALSSMLLAMAFSPARGAEASAPATNGTTPPSIIVTDVKVMSLTEIVRATGTIKPVEEVYVQPLVEGLSVETINAEIGDRVDEGDVLATLRTDSLLLQKSSLQASKAKAEASLAQLNAQLTANEAAQTDARRQFERTRRLADSGSVSTSALEQAETAALRADASTAAAREAVSVAEADINVQQAQIDDIDLRLERTKIKAPVSGIVSGRNARIGAIATGASTPMFTMIRDGAIELVAEVPEDNMMKVEEGQTAMISLVGDAPALSGTVRLVSPVVDNVTRLGDVFISIDEPGRARPGMYASAEIIVEEAENLALPMTAVNIGRQGATVRRVKDDTVEIVTVKTGIQDDDTIEIVEGLAEGDQVVAKAGAYVRAGDRITAVSAAEAPLN